MARQCVIDANLALGFVLQLPYSDQAEHQMRVWKDEKAKLIVPMLWEYDCLTGLRRAVTMKMISSKDAERMAEALLALELQSAAPTLETHLAALHWAERIGQSKAYDAQYLALAEHLSAEFWTADRNLYRSIQALGVEWIHTV